jgi:hypothetical protein
VDLASFMASLRATVGILPLGGSAERKLRDAFLGGYEAGPDARVDDDALALCELYVLAQRVADPFDYPPPPLPKRLWEYYVLRHDLTRLEQCVRSRAEEQPDPSTTPPPA